MYFTTLKILHQKASAMKNRSLKFDRLLVSSYFTELFDKVICIRLYKYIYHYVISRQPLNWFSHYYSGNCKCDNNIQNPHIIMDRKKLYFIVFLKTRWISVSFSQSIPSFHDIITH
jgi:hypothetical protein